MLQLVYEHSLKWRFKFNYDKCGVVVFDNTNTKRQEIKYGKCSKICLVVALQIWTLFN